MNAKLAAIARILKGARQAKGLSQSALARKVGLPQSHISKIENAAVDLQTSNLIEITRALDLELMLVPRQLVPAVQALQRPVLDSTLPSSAQKPVYSLEDDGDA